MLIDQYDSNLPEYSHQMHLQGYSATEVYRASKKSKRKLLQRILKYNEEILDILFIDCSKCTQTECVCCGNLSRIDGKATLIAIVVNLLKAPVWIIRIDGRRNKTSSPFRFDYLLNCGMFFFGSVT